MEGKGSEAARQKLLATWDAEDAAMEETWALVQRANAALTGGRYRECLELSKKAVGLAEEAVGGPRSGRSSARLVQALHRYFMAHRSLGEGAGRHTACVS